LFWFCDDNASDGGCGCNGVIVTAGGIIVSIIGVWPRLVIMLGCWKEEKEKSSLKKLFISVTLSQYDYGRFHFGDYVK